MNNRYKMFMRDTKSRMNKLISETKPDTQGINITELGEIKKKSSSIFLAAVI